jgi:hypothetical protein
MAMSAFGVEDSRIAKALSAREKRHRVASDAVLGGAVGGAHGALLGGSDYLTRGFKAPGATVGRRLRLLATNPTLVGAGIGAGGLAAYTHHQNIGKALTSEQRRNAYAGGAAAAGGGAVGAGLGARKLYQLARTEPTGLHAGTAADAALESRIGAAVKRVKGRRLLRAHGLAGAAGAGVLGAGALGAAAVHAHRNKG